MLRHIAAALLTAIAVGSIPALAAAQTVPYTVASGRVAAYAADGERVLYQFGIDDEKSSTPTESIIRLHDLQSQTERTIATDALPFSLALSGDLAAYTVKTGDQQQTLFLHDLKSNTRTEVASSALIGGVRMAGGRLVWGQPIPNVNATIPFFVYEIATGETRELDRLSLNKDSYGRILAHHFDGRYLAWAAGIEINALDVTTGTVHKYTAINRLRDVVGIDAGRVLYESIDNSACEGSAAVGVRVWNVATGEDQHAGSKECRAARSAIRGDVVAWPTYTETGPTSVKLRFLKGGALRTLLTDDMFKDNLALTDRYVVYQGAEQFQGSKLVAAPVQPDGLPLQPAKPVFYTVQPSDSLWRIAQRYKVTLPDLVRSNNLLNPNAISPGQNLYLPYPVSPLSETYTVRSGDTLTRIALPYKTTLSNLARLNKLQNPNYLYVGQQLQISRGPEALSDELWIYQTYAVMPGDTLWTIAQRAGVGMNSLVTLNKLQNPNWINPGTLLTIRQQAWPQPR